MFTKFVSAILITAALMSCGGNEKKAETVEPAMAPHHDSTTEKKPDFSAVHFDSDKDFSCGMSIKSGVEDTTHYKGKVYGFCSKECKEDFLKDPEAALAKK